jgi:hypothetical protein
MERFNAFLKVSATELITQIVATPIAALMMKRSPWLPLFLSSAINLISYVLCLRLAETRPGRVEETSQSSFSPGWESDQQEQEDQKAITRDSVKKFKSVLKSTKSLLWGNSSVVILLLVFFVACFGKESLELLLQYISKRYLWDYSQASLSITLQASVSLGLNVLLLPGLDSYLRIQRNMPAPTKDLRLSQGSCLLLFVGYLMIALSHHPGAMLAGVTLTALGSSFPLTLRSYATSFISPSRVGTLYTGITVVMSAGLLISGPILYSLFRWGMSLDNFWLGLPYVFVSLLYFLAGVAIFSVGRLSKTQIW